MEIKFLLAFILLITQVACLLIWVVWRSLLRRYYLVSFDHNFFHAARRAFAEWEEEPIVVAARSGNPHELHNRVRARAESLMRHICATSRREPYFVQKERGQTGSSQFIDPVDWDCSTDPYPARPVKIYVDCDYYLDMSEELNGDPILIYGFSPEAAVARDGDMTDYWVRKNKVYFAANAGYRDRHYLWDYGADYVSVPQYDWRARLTGKPSGMMTYRVCRLDLGHDRVLTALCPWFAHSINHPDMQKFRARHVLRRHVLSLEGQKYNWTLFKYWSREGMMVAFAVEGQTSRGCVLKLGEFQAACDLARFVRGRLGHHNVNVATQRERSWLVAELLDDVNIDKLKIDVLERGWRPGAIRDIELTPTAPKMTQCAGPANACTLHTDVVHEGRQEDLPKICSKKLDVVPKENVGVTVIKPTPGTTVCSPVRSPEQMETAILERVVKPQNAALKRMDRSFKFSVAGLDFLRRFIPAQLKPLTDAEVLGRVPAKSRELVRQGLLEDITVANRQLAQVKPFIKGETYASIKPPRLITPLHPAVQAHGYRYVYPLQDALEEQEWFAFGRPPRLVAERIARISDEARQLGYVCFETDYSKYDGSITIPVREMEATMYKALYGEDDPILNRFLQYSANVVYGKSKSTRGARCSGAPDTCLMNSIDSFIAIANEIGYEHCAKFGCFGGDDGILFAPLAMKDRIERAVARFGFELKMTVRKPGEEFTFLARVFNWGDPNSMCDVDRLMGKVGIVMNVIPSGDKYRVPRLLMKICSLLDSDANTPGVGDVLKRMHKELSENPAAHGKVPDAFLPGWWERKRQEAGPWPNERQAWMVGVWERSQTFKHA